MIFDVLLLAILVVWIIFYIKNKNAIRALPCLIMIFVTPFYNILDSKIFVEIFGCGCVPVAQTNMFNIDFNANHLRLVVYNIIAVLMFILGTFLSRNFESKKAKIIYMATILIFNILLAHRICQLYMWG